MAEGVILNNLIYELLYVNFVQNIENELNFFLDLYATKQKIGVVVTAASVLVFALWYINLFARNVGP